MSQSDDVRRFDRAFVALNALMVSLSHLPYPMEPACCRGVAPPLRPDSAMSFVVYFLVLLVAAGSVLFGFDWLQSPLPTTSMRQKVPVAIATAKSTPAKKSTKPDAAAADRNTKQLDAKLSPVYPAHPVAPQTGEVSAANMTTEARPRPRCDIDACARAYYTFRPFDCTYQPSNGPRRLCTRGNPPKPAAESASAVNEATQARAEATCNIAACERAYASFSASDCTYQPYNGPRRLCTK
jgi:hypothetical protein